MNNLFLLFEQQRILSIPFNHFIEDSIFWDFETESIQYGLLIELYIKGGGFNIKLTFSYTLEQDLELNYASSYEALCVAP